MKIDIKEKVCSSDKTLDEKDGERLVNLVKTDTGYSLEVWKLKELLSKRDVATIAIDIFVLVFIAFWTPYVAYTEFSTFGERAIVFSVGGFVWMLALAKLTVGTFSLYRRVKVGRERLFDLCCRDFHRLLTSIINAAEDKLKEEREAKETKSSKEEKVASDGNAKSKGKDGVRSRRGQNEVSPQLEYAQGW